MTCLFKCFRSHSMDCRMFLPDLHPHVAKKIHNHARKRHANTHTHARTFMPTAVPSSARAMRLMAMTEIYLFKLESCDMALSAGLCRHLQHTTPILINHAPPTPPSQFHRETASPPPRSICTQLSQKAFSALFTSSKPLLALLFLPLHLSHPVHLTHHLSPREHAYQSSPSSRNTP